MLKSTTNNLRYSLPLFAYKTIPRSHLEIRARRCGFFGNLFITLNGILYCIENQCAFEIFWGPEFLYTPKNAKSSNSWTEFFPAICINDQKKTIGIPLYPSALKTSFSHHNRDRPNLSQLILKYFTPTTTISARIETEAQRLSIGPHTLGIHYRATDAAAGHEGRITEKTSSYFNQIDNWLKTRTPNGNILLCTDQEDIVALFKDRYKDTIVHTNAYRSPNNLSIHGHYDDGCANDKLERAREVLIEATLLSKTGRLIRHQSKVTDYSLCLNPNLAVTEMGEPTSVWR